MSYENGIVEKAIRSLGKGFDITSDFRLKYCKGNERFVLLNETETRDLSVQGFGTFKHVSVDIKCDKGDRTRYQSDILDFKQMSEFFNRKCSVPGKIPSGSFNSMFGFESGSWSTDASNTQYLGLDGYFIILFSVHIDRYPLVLSDQVRNAVPSTWDPSALARFIEKYGTHIIVGLSVGGQDVVLVRQDSSSKSNDEASHLKNHLDELGDQLFTGAGTFSPHHFKHPKQKVFNFSLHIITSRARAQSLVILNFVDDDVVLYENLVRAHEAFNVFDPEPVVYNSLSHVLAKDVGLILTHCEIVSMIGIRAQTIEVVDK